MNNYKEAWYILKTYVDNLHDVYVGSYGEEVTKDILDKMNDLDNNEVVRRYIYHLCQVTTDDNLLQDISHGINTFFETYGDNPTDMEMNYDTANKIYSCAGKALDFVEVDYDMSHQGLRGEYSGYPIYINNALEDNKIYFRY